MTTPSLTADQSARIAKIADRLGLPIEAFATLGDDLPLLANCEELSADEWHDKGGETYTDNPYEVGDVRQHPRTSQRFAVVGKGATAVAVELKTMDMPGLQPNGVRDFKLTPVLIDGRPVVKWRNQLMCKFQFISSHGNPFQFIGFHATGWLHAGELDEDLETVSSRIAAEYDDGVLGWFGRTPPQ